MADERPDGQAKVREDGWYWVRLLAGVSRNYNLPWAPAFWKGDCWFYGSSIRKPEKLDIVGPRIPTPGEHNPTREAFAWLYQWAGAMNAPVSILDNLSALAQGEPAPHEWQYPAMPDERPALTPDIDVDALTGTADDQLTPGFAEAARKYLKPALELNFSDPDVILRSIEASLGTLDHSAAIDDEDWREQVAEKVSALVNNTAELERTVEGLRADGERLDWLETHELPSSSPSPRLTFGVGETAKFPWGVAKLTDMSDGFRWEKVDWRETIDQARTPEPSNDLRALADWMEKL